MHFKILSKISATLVKAQCGNHDNMLERIVVIDYSVDFEITQIEKNFTIMVPNLACAAAKAVRS